MIWATDFQSRLLMGQQLQFLTRKTTVSKWQIAQKEWALPTKGTIWHWIAFHFVLAHVQTYSIFQILSFIAVDLHSLRISVTMSSFNSFKLKHQEEGLTKTPFFLRMVLTNLRCSAIFWLFKNSL